MLGIKRCRQHCFDLTAIHQRFQFVSRFLVISDHFLRKRLSVFVRLLREGQPARLNFEHVADRHLVYELLCGLRCAAPTNTSEANSPHSATKIDLFLMIRLPESRGSMPLSQVMVPKCICSHPLVLELTRQARAGGTAVRDRATTRTYGVGEERRLSFDAPDVGGKWG
jgi:hypothetical protein